METILKILSFVTFLSTSVAGDGQKQSHDTKSKILRIAEEKAGSLGHKVLNMNVEFDVGNRQFKTYTDNVGKKNLQKAFTHLTGKDWQAIYFTPKEGGFGGDLWIFVDTKSLRVLTYLEGE